MGSSSRLLCDPQLQSVCLFTLQCLWVTVLAFSRTYCYLKKRKLKWESQSWWKKKSGVHLSVAFSLQVLWNYSIWEYGKNKESNIYIYWTDESNWEQPILLPAELTCWCPSPEVRAHFHPKVPGYLFDFISGHLHFILQLVHTILFTTQPSRRAYWAQTFPILSHQLLDSFFSSEPMT